MKIIRLMSLKIIRKFGRKSDLLEDIQIHLINQTIVHKMKGKFIFLLNFIL